MKIILYFRPLLIIYLKPIYLLKPETTVWKRGACFACANAALDPNFYYRVTTCLENLKMSGNFDSCQGNVRDFTENQGNVGELAEKKSCQGKVA